MAASIQELILQDIETALGAISIANGYRNDIGAVSRWQDDEEQQPLEPTPAIVIKSGDKVRTNGPNGKKSWVLEVNLAVVLVHDHTADARSTDAVLTSLEDDIHDALMVDPNRAGNALGTDVTRTQKVPPALTHPRVWLMIDVDVYFRHALRDASSHGAGV